MSWNDAPQLEGKLKRALDAFDWQEAQNICRGLIDRIKVDSDLIPETSGKIIMNSLRRKRRFHLMTEVAEAILQSGLRTPQIRRQYAQALIDQGILAAGEMVLQTIIQDPMGIKAEEQEARGLTGRIYKQIYVNNNDPTSPRNRENLERALKEYLYVYRLNPQEYLWHGINVVALLDRARRDNFTLAALPDPSKLAEEILATLDERERQSTGDLPAYDVATVMEAYVALGRHEDAERTAMRYVDSAGADAFELNSTIRQLTEVWQLTYKEPPGNHLLPILRAGHLRTEGAADAREAKKVLEEAEAVGEALKDLEAVFGEDRMVTLGWYKKGLDRCNSIARVERLSGKGHGTGWLVKASDFFADGQGTLLLTNEHVISDDDQHPRAIFPEDAQANFQALGQVLKVKEIVWSNSYMDLDATFVSLEGDPKADPLEIHPRALQMPQPPKAAPRLYIIGHPEGRDLELSLQDNNLLGCNDKVLHYRTPTEPGSSGSPAFEPDDWRVVALHHKGSKQMQRIDGVAGMYEANEGIALRAIQNATK